VVGELETCLNKARGQRGVGFIRALTSAPSNRPYVTTMRIAPLVFLSLAVPHFWVTIIKGQDEATSISCFFCHMEIIAEMKTQAVKHWEAGTRCEACHGASIEHLDVEDNSVKPDKVWNDTSVHLLCGECHQTSSDGYVSSCHADLAVNSRPAAEKAPNCSGCHGYHGLKTPAEIKGKCLSCHPGLPASCVGGSGAGNEQAFPCKRCHDSHSLASVKNHILRLALLCVSLPTHTGMIRASSPGFSEQQAQEWRGQIRQALFIPDPLPELAQEEHGRFSPEPGIVAERITYQTQFGLRVPAIVYRPEHSPGKVPGLIIVNGHGGDKYSWYAFYAGVLYARAGAVVLTFDPIGEGERNRERKSGTRAHDTFLPPEEMGRRMGGQLITDVLQAVTYLFQRPEVDPKRIGVMGYSLGSFLVSLAGAIDTRLRACVMVGGGNLGGPGDYWDLTKPMCQSIPYGSLLFLGDRAAVIYALHASRGPTLVLNGLEDTVVAIPTHREPFFRALRDRTAQLRGTDQGVFEAEFVPDASHRPFFVTKPAALWLEKQLDFPNWDRASITAMTETHISEWARTNAVELDPLYSNEQREGGTRALGTGVPGLSRECLSVFSLEEWQRLKEHLVYESWVAAARKATNMQILWPIDKLSEIGGLKPKVLGNPQVTGALGNSALVFDGQDDGIILNTNPLSGARSFTVEVIFRPDPSPNKAQRFLHMQANDENRVLVETRLNDANQWFLDTFIKSGESEKTLQSGADLHPVGKWYHAALTYDGHWMRHYVNGKEEAAGEVEYVPVEGGQTSIGCRLNQVFWFQGAIQKVRITYAALAPDQFLAKPE
jgi:dienelactone hydrolase